jgi:type II secretory ATPase GspE/PulE/Tfp pilus assembly ATPase PilB-like protein
MFGQYLLEKNAVNEEQLAGAIDAQRYMRRPIGRVLRDLAILTQAQLNLHLEQFLSPRIDASVSKLEECLKAMPVSPQLREWAQSFDVLCQVNEDGSLTFLGQAFRDEVIEKSEKEFGRACSFYILERDVFQFLRNRLLGAEDHERSGLITEERLDDDQRLGRDGPYASLFRDILDTAQKSGASDIHLQPEYEGVDLRLRVDGELYTWKSLGVEHRLSFINEAKRLSGLSIAKSGSAQDGRVSLKSRKLDIRSSLLPTNYGEKIVLRLLEQDKDFRLEARGFEDAITQDLNAALTAKNGLLIVSGPTGSGKTTLLYSLLCAIDRLRKNVVTLEDPIEYTIPRISQTQITPKLSFAQALRAVLRQDPDVILVGEIRDQETADLCVKAASTGHLVLSTLHANGASEVVTRLLNLGIDRYTLKSCLRFSAAQRLIRKLCPICTEPAPHAARSLVAEKCLERKIRISRTAELRVRSREGCENCRSKAIGRKPVLEYMRAPEVQAFLSQGDGAVPQFRTTLKESAVRLAEKGEVDVYEALELE